MSFGQLHLDWISGITALVANHYKTERSVLGWWLSLAANVMFGCINAHLAMWGLLALAIINCGVSIRGIILWSKIKPHKKSSRRKVKNV